jgi:hypothetical protein
MKLLILLLSSLLLAACSDSGSVDFTAPTPPATNNDGSVVTGIVTAVFDPAGGNIPFPNNLLLSGSGDLTLNIPVADPTDFSDPQVALNALDGFSTVSPWSSTFTDSINPATVMAGSSVRVFEVTTFPNTIAVSGVVRELTPDVDYVATLSSLDPSNATLAIVPLRPLQQLTTYMAVLTDGIRGADGTDVTPSQTYFLTKRSAPLLDANGNSTLPLLDNGTAMALEPLRQLTNAQEAAFTGFTGVPSDEVVLSWTMSTQSITPTLQILRSQTQPAPVSVVRTPFTTAEVLPPGASPGRADVYVGTISLPYYLGVPSAEDPLAPLNDFWRAAPGAYLPPFDQLPLDPTSTNVTVANPIPVQTDVQTVPVLMTVPNAASGASRPPSGWPVAIYMHGITRNRSDMLAVADTLASAGFAVIAIDQVLHGITDVTSPLYIDNTGFLGNERTFDLDLVNNATGAPGPDGMIDASGAQFVNLANLLASRDNLRQSSADLSVLAVSIPGIDIDGDTLPDFDGGAIRFVGQSLGAMAGIPFLAVEPTVNTGLLSVPGGGIANLLAGSASFGPAIAAGLQAAAGIEPGSPEFFQFLGAAQQVVDSSDPINWAGLTAASNAVVLQTVIDDQVIPNTVPGAPLSGGFPLIAAMQLPSINSTTSDAMGVRANVTFLPPASHGSLLDPTASPAATAEMQGEMASLLSTGGTTVVIANPDVIQ